MADQVLSVPAGSVSRRQEAQSWGTGLGADDDRGPGPILSSVHSSRPDGCWYCCKGHLALGSIVRVTLSMHASWVWQQAKDACFLYGRRKDSALGSSPFSRLDKDQYGRPNPSGSPTSMYCLSLPPSAGADLV